MDETEVIAVVGSCPPERLMYATELAKETHQNLISAAQLGAPNPVQKAMELALHGNGAVGVVIEFPSEASMEEIVWTFAGLRPRSHLTNIVCVIDAAHLRGDLQRDDYFSRPDIHRRAVTVHTARALLTVTQIEHASTTMLVNWEGLPTDELSTVMALVSHLNPGSRLRLHHASISAEEDHVSPSPTHTQPGWVGLLNGDFSPHMTDNHVCGFRYENVRPFHPGRLAHLLDERIEPGEFGTIVRSAGYCRFASEPNITAQWEHVGKMIAFNPFIDDNILVDKAAVISLGQDLAIIGLDIDIAALSLALDEATLSDAEFAAGPMVWQTFENPFPARQTITGTTE